MTDDLGYLVALFQSVSQVMKADKILSRENIPFKLIPVPKMLSSECGVCIRFLPEDRERITSTLAGEAPPQSIQPMPQRR